VTSGSHLSIREARRTAIRAQGLGGPRPAPNRTKSQLRRLLDQVGTIQLDAVNVVARTQFLVPFSRIGGYDPALLLDLVGPGRPWFEYWGHAASLLPVDVYPLAHWRMERSRNDLVAGGAAQGRRRAWRDAHAAYIQAVLDEVTDRGPLTASQLSDPRRREGDWWERRSDGRRALELLFGDGDLAGWRTAGFERVYDLTERVIPAAVLNLPTPPEGEAQRELLAIAARCMGVATVTDLADYFWIRPASARLRVAELVEERRLVPVAVEGWTSPAYAAPGASSRAPRGDNASLLSPFDSLIWTRDRTERLFGFHYRIEIYVPALLRTHGYYVMPMLLGDDLVARFDLKADRQAGILRVAGSYLEASAEQDDLVPAAVAELESLRRWLGLKGLWVADRGDLSTALGSALAVAGTATPTDEAVATA
jgi:uncharacterized protein